MADAKMNLQQLMEPVFFEQWLRFYFIEEEKGELYIRVPEEVGQEIKEDHPELFPVVEALNNKVIDCQTALAALCDNMVNGPDAFGREDWVAVFSGSDFQIILQLLGFWLQSEEDELDMEVLPFAEWFGRFLAWKETDAVKDYAARIKGAWEPCQSKVQ